MDEMAEDLNYWRDKLAKCKAQRDASILHAEELRKALSQLVRDIEDTWRHGGRCLIGTDEQKPETECECGIDIIDEPLEILARSRPST